MKATHSGTCQWCSAQQKLPGGKLSTHGYTVAHGWFQGVCSGSHELPYEISCDLIKESIAWAQERHASIAAKREEILAIDPATTNKCWKEVRHDELARRSIGSVWIWHEVELIQDTPDNDRNHHFIDYRGKLQACHGWEKLAEKVAKGNQSYAYHLARQLKQIEDYIAQQQRRVDAWKPAELVPVK